MQAPLNKPHNFKKQETLSPLRLCQSIRPSSEWGRFACSCCRWLLFDSALHIFRDKVAALFSYSIGSPARRRRRKCGSSACCAFSCSAPRRHWLQLRDLGALPVNGRRLLVKRSLFVGFCFAPFWFSCVCVCVVVFQLMGGVGRSV